VCWPFGGELISLFIGEWIPFMGVRSLKFGG